MNLSTYLKELGRPIVLYANLARAFGHNEALLLQQISFWEDMGTPEGWIFKSYGDLEKETALSIRQQQTARKNLVRMGILEERYERRIHRMWLRIDHTKLHERWKGILDDRSQSPELPKGEVPNSQKGKSIRRDEMRKKSPLPPGGGAGVPSFWDDTDVTRNDQSMIWAKQLYSGLQKARRIYTDVKIHSWAREFRNLLHVVGNEEEIQMTLDWYLEHFRNRFCPKAYAAGTFRQKYAQLRDRMEADPAAQPKLDPAALDKHERKLHDSLAECDWPDVTPLPHLIRESRRQYIAFVRALESQCEGEQRHHNFARFLRRGSELCPASSLPVHDFLVGWFEERLRLLRFRQNWDGSLPPDEMIFSLRHPEVAKIGARASTDYCGSTKLWTMLHPLLTAHAS